MAPRDPFAPPPEEDDLVLETEDEYRARIRLDRGASVEEQSGEAHVQRARRRGTRWRRLLLLTLLGMAGWETGATLVQHVSAPTGADWKRAATWLSDQRDPANEPLLFAPAWVEPLGRLHFGEQLVFEQQLLSDVDRHAKVWLVSTRGAKHPWLSDGKPAQSRSFGRVKLELFEQQPVDVLFDFTARVTQARVERVRGKQPQLCAWQGQRAQCDPRQRWNWVGPHLAEVGHRPYRCIFAHAVDDHVMRISFTDVPLGRSLVGYTGIDDFENRKRAQAPVQLRVLAGDKVLGIIHHLNDWPWHRFALSTKELNGQHRQVSFEVTTERAFARTFCFAAEVRQ